jgi:hypothetical protein
MQRMQHLRAHNDLNFRTQVLSKVGLQHSSAGTLLPALKDTHVALHTQYLTLQLHAKPTLDSCSHLSLKRGGSSSCLLEQPWQNSLPHSRQWWRSRSSGLNGSCKATAAAAAGA